MNPATVDADSPSDPKHRSAPDVTLSVVIPAYNEAATIERVLDGVWRTAAAHQIILVDDGSTDQTGAIVAKWMERTGVPVVVRAHVRNLGKGQAIRSALPLVTGSHVVIQDADLECDPNDLLCLLAALDSHGASVIYGSRYLQARSLTSGRSLNRLGVRFLNGMLRILYGKSITDEATCYKLLPTALLRSLDLRCHRFEFCSEVTAKLCRLGWPIVEVPISYYPRTAAQGKKLKATDGLGAISSLIRWRIAPLPASALRPVAKVACAKS